MIPKTVHYCWFGGKPLPDDAIRCIDSWKRIFPGYEIKEWNESNCDFSDCRYAQEAYSANKFAFVSDYARFKILYEYGGVYFDTDVEVIKSMDDVLEKGSFMGMERNGIVNPGLGLAANPGLGFYRLMLEKYRSMHFLNSDGSCNLKTIVDYTTEEMVKLGLKQTTEVQCVDGIYIYPLDFFCPMDYLTGKITITSNTRSIHHYKASWHSEREELAHTIQKKLNTFLPAKVSGHIGAFIATLKCCGLRETAYQIVKIIRSN